jgi:lipopolysaccharide/colanic/teichoic acid biosynthesis glycosyltransferase
MELGSVHYTDRYKPLTRGDRLQKLGKRSFDVIVSLGALVLLAPFFPLLWLIVYLDSRGPVIFKQERVGQDGRLFTCLKIRTMYYGADECIHQKAIERIWAGEKISNNPESQFKLTDDARVTRVGRWLRTTSMDELPQLLNVLRGEMSIVGPRPAIPYELRHYTDWHHERHSVKPGITGLWQVRGRGGLDLNEMMKLDVEYSRTWSLWLDIKIIALTIPTVLKARGAG